MRNIFALLFFVSFSYVFAQQRAEFEENHLVVKLKESVYESSKIDLNSNSFGIPILDNLMSELRISEIKPIGQHKITRTFLLIFQNPVAMAIVSKGFKESGAVDYAEPDYISYGGGQKADDSAIIPNDNYFNRQWGTYNNGTMAGIGPVINDADVDLEMAWDIQTGDPNLIIAVPDSGLRLSHPEISSRLWINPNEIANGLDDDGNGLIDDLNGWDWVNNDNLPVDDLGHGTNVAGIIGAVANNNSLYTGVNWNSKIMPLKVLNASNAGTNTNIASSVYYAVDNGAKIISISIGGSAPSSLTAGYVSYAKDNNVLIVACMMNTNNNIPFYPAAYSTTNDNLIAVGSTDANDQRTSPFFWSPTSGSNYGNHINVVAPGNYIYGLDYNSNTNGNTYWGGTSQATPLVAGIASLLLSQNPSLTPSEIRTIIQNTAQDQVGLTSEDVLGFDQYMGYGRVNAFAALQTLGTIDFNAQLQEFQIINPEKNGLFQIFCKGQYPGAYIFTVTTIEGKQLLSLPIDLQQGINNIPFNYMAGTYIIALKSERYSKIFKVIKE